MEVAGIRCLRRGFCSLLLIAIANLICREAMAAEQKILFNIPAGPAHEALQQFFFQSKVEVLYLPEVVNGRSTRDVVGELEPEQALQRLLSGTGLTFRFVSRSFVTIHVGESQAAHPRSTSANSTAHSTLVELDDRLPSHFAKVDFRHHPINEVTVTGSMIRGVLDIVSPLHTVTADDVRKSSYGTVHNILETLPIVFGSEQNEHFGGVGNFSRGTAIDLRGLGHEATLVLVNGRRQPQAGVEADFVDVAHIPWSLIERIEVLPDGSSALYGSDAIAGVVNIILRDELDGLESHARIGTAEDGAKEILVAQIAGGHTEGGRWLAAYQYSERTSLSANDRPYVANADRREQGGRDHRIIYTNPGNILDPATLLPAYAIPKGQPGSRITPEELLQGTVNLRNRLEDVDLYPNKKIHTLSLSGTLQASRGLEAFLESRISRFETDYSTYANDQILFVPPTNPYFVTPYNDANPVLLAYSFHDILGPSMVTSDSLNAFGAAGVTVRASEAWKATLSLSSGSERIDWMHQNSPNSDALNKALADTNPDTAFDPFSSGSFMNPATLQAIRDSQRHRMRSNITVMSFIADGPLFDFRAAPIKLAAGMEHRQEGLTRESTSFTRKFERNVSALFTEVSIPLVRNSRDRGSTPLLDLSLSGRFEKYSDFGRTFNKKMGLRWAPASHLKFRSSWGTSFRAPELLDLYYDLEDAAGIGSIPDPRSPTGNSLIIGIQGNNPDLKEESATTWTGGIDIALRSAPGATVSLTYFRTRYKDRVVRPGPPSPYQILLEENLWSEVITRIPSRSMIAAICDSPIFFGSKAQCKAAQPTVFIDFRLRNLASTELRGIDLKLESASRHPWGHLNISLLGSYIFDFKQALSRTTSAVNAVDTLHNPLRLKLFGAAEWSANGPDLPGLRIGVTSEYSGGYRDPDSPALNDIDAAATLNLHLSYLTPADPGSWGSLEIALNAANVLGAEPPIVDTERGYDFFNATPVGRVVNFHLLKRW